MKFFFAENCDQVDPHYDFIRDQPNRGRNRSDDISAHEALDSYPYDGILVSRSIIEGQDGAKRYTQSQKYQVLREGIRSFLNYPMDHEKNDHEDFPIIGDCGSFSYIDKENPPYRAEDTFNFYIQTAFTYGVSPDHIITENNEKWDNHRLRPSHVQDRIDFTENSAKQFIELCNESKQGLVPIAPIQSWSYASAVKHAKKLISMGYDYLGLGGIASKHTEYIINLVNEIRTAIPESIRLHLFGFSPMDSLHEFQGLGITSFDSTGPMIRSFKDNSSNYFNSNGKHYPAIRIPPTNDSKTNQLLKSGKICSSKYIELESNALSLIRKYSKNECSVDKVLNAIHSFDQISKPGSDNRSKYARLLKDRPWEKCGCKICKDLGVEVVIHRSLNRHKRRGFHNLWVFYNRLKKVRSQNSIKVPCLKTEQSKGKRIYSFSINGKDISKFASISRIARDESGELKGYQRPEIATHIDEIQQYLEKSDSILPNALIIAFNEKIKFDKVSEESQDTEFGHLTIPISKTKKIGWVVDGQQRLAAIRRMNRSKLSVPVTAIESKDTDYEREQFVLINNTRPLPKSLVYELLPSIGEATPPRLQRRRKAYEVLQILANNDKSPFFQKIKTTTSSDIPTAIIKDVSVLRMIENSTENGALSSYGNRFKKQAMLLIQYWNAVAKVYEEAWELIPRLSRLTHGAGIISMGYLMDAISFKLRHEEKPLATHHFVSELKKIGDLPWTQGSWEFAPDFVLPWNGIQNTSKDIDLLTNHLIRIYQSNYKANKNV